MLGKNDNNKKSFESSEINTEVFSFSVSSCLWWCDWYRQFKKIANVFHVFSFRRLINHLTFLPLSEKNPKRNSYKRHALFIFIMYAMFPYTMCTIRTYYIEYICICIIARWVKKVAKRFYVQLDARNMWKINLNTKYLLIYAKKA